MGVYREEARLLAVAIPAGLLIGLSLGALGGGGSILTIPVLVYLLHQRPARMCPLLPARLPPRRRRYRMASVFPQPRAGPSPPPWTSQRLTCSHPAGPWPGRVLAGPRLSARV